MGRLYRHVVLSKQLNYKHGTFCGSFDRLSSPRVLKQIEHQHKMKHILTQNVEF